MRRRKQDERKRLRSCSRCSQAPRGRVRPVLWPNGGRFYGVARKLACRLGQRGLERRDELERGHRAVRDGVHRADEVEEEVLLIAEEKPEEVKRIPGWIYTIIADFAMTLCFALVFAVPFRHHPAQ